MRYEIIEAVNGFVVNVLDDTTQSGIVLVARTIEEVQEMLVSKSVAELIKLHVERSETEKL